MTYDIAGDIPAGYQSGRPGVHANLDEIAARFEGRSKPATFVDRLRSTSSYLLIAELMDKLMIANPQPARVDESFFKNAKPKKKKMDND